MKKKELPLAGDNQDTSTVFAPPAIANSLNNKDTEPELRNIPRKELSPAAVQSMLKVKGFFDSRRNPSAASFSHEFEIQNEGNIIYDHACDVIWQQSGSQVEMAYYEAQNYISRLNNDSFAGFRDWRLPTLEEAMSLMESSEKNNGMHVDAIFDTHQKSIWTSDFRRTTMAWVVWFEHGYCDYVYNDGNIKHCVRAVRNRQ